MAECTPGWQHQPCPNFERSPRAIPDHRSPSNRHGCSRQRRRIIGPGVGNQDLELLGKSTDNTNHTGDSVQTEADYNATHTHDLIIGHRRQYWLHGKTVFGTSASYDLACGWCKREWCCTRDVQHCRPKGGPERCHLHYCWRATQTEQKRGSVVTNLRGKS